MPGDTETPIPATPLRGYRRYRWALLCRRLPASRLQLFCSVRRHFARRVRWLGHYLPMMTKAPREAELPADTVSILVTESCVAPVVPPAGKGGGAGEVHQAHRQALRPEGELLVEQTARPRQVELRRHGLPQGVVDRVLRLAAPLGWLQLGRGRGPFGIDIEKASLAPAN